MASSQAHNRTIVRAKIAAIRAGFGVAEKVAPALGGRYATRLWLTVPRAPSVPPAPAGGESFSVRVGDSRVRGMHFGSGPAVYLMHGWGGAGRQLSAFVDPLRIAGFRAVLFDAPSHGRSDPGTSGPRRTHGVEFAAALSAVMRHFGPADTVLAHSMGALPSLMVHRDGLPIGRFVFLAPMRDLLTYLPRFAAQLKMGPRIMSAMDDQVTRLVGRSMSGMDIRLLADGPPPVPMLIVHDRADRETLHDHSAEAVDGWPGPATMISTNGLGHRRLLTDPDVVRQVVAFIGVPADRAPQSLQIAVDRASERVEH